jgi:hypothetical protein
MAESVDDPGFEHTEQIAAGHVIVRDVLGSPHRRGTTE